ncbi:hypothetical protein MPB2EB_0973 [Mycoavidus sp. B2-EB]|nr:hypothetical protein MPB2EB_0973 [Mycoavidus sp. B2-EB]
MSGGEQSAEVPLRENPEIYFCDRCNPDGLPPTYGAMSAVTLNKRHYV